MRHPKTKRNTRHDIQYRFVTLRADGDSGDDGGSDVTVNDAGYSGHAAIFNVVDAYGTAFKPGAFAKTLQERGERIPALYQHNPSWPIGRHRELKEDDAGLYVDVAVIEDAIYGKEAMSLLRGGVPLGQSFGFETIKSRPYEEADEDTLDFSHAPRWAQNPDNRDWIWIIEEVRLWETSIVTFPANELADIDDVRAIAEADAIASLTERIRGGTLSSVHEPLIADLVAAYQQRPEPKPDPDTGTTPLGSDHARHRNRFAEASLLFSELGMPLGVD